MSIINNAHAADMEYRRRLDRLIDPGSPGFGQERVYPLPTKRRAPDSMVGSRVRGREGRSADLIEANITRYEEPGQFGGEGRLIGTTDEGKEVRLVPSLCFTDLRRW